MRARRRTATYSDGPRYAGSPLHLSTTRPAHAPASETFRVTNTSKVSGSFAPIDHRLPDGEAAPIHIKTFGMPKIGKTHE